MSGKNIVFKVEVTSPVHGSFRAGDVGKNVDAAWAADLIAGGYAAYTTDATQKADADAAADAAGRLTTENRKGSRTQKVEHTFSASGLAAQRAAGVVTTGPTDNTVGAEKTNARMAGTAPAPSAKATADASATEVARADVAPQRAPMKASASAKAVKGTAAKKVDAPKRATAKTKRK